jgi:hypothetical protein
MNVLIINICVLCEDGSFRKWDVGIRTGSSRLGIETGGRHFECGNEPSGSIKCWEFLD